jgi:ubiquinone biosynthesis protein Coq4
MVNTTQPTQVKAWTTALNPLMHTGINWSELRLAYRTFRKDPAQGIRHIIAAARASHWQKWVKSRLARQVAHLEKDELSINMAELSKLPEHTLGRAYAQHMISQGFDPEAFMIQYGTQESCQDSWLDKRFALSHDVYHVITGFDASPVGEFGLAALCLAQQWNLLNVFVLSFLPLNVISNFSLAPRLIASTLKGFIMGLICKPIFAYPFESNWHKPVSEVRKDLGI